jgi:8-oxo-dGTP diphosphatase
MSRAGRRNAATAPTSAAADGGDDEARFLAEYDPSAYERLSVAVDIALISAFDGDLYTLLHRRREHPFKDRWSLPGGFVRPAESLEQAAARLLAAKGGLTQVFLEQLYSFGAPERDPRTRVVSIAYYALVDKARFVDAGAHGDDVITPRIRVPWAGETGGSVQTLGRDGRPLPLAFDHADILGTAVKRLRGKLDYAPIGFQMLGETFTLLELQRIHEIVLGRSVNKDSFRRRMLASGLLKPTGRSQTGVGHRPAELYRFVRKSAI